MPKSDADMTDFQRPAGRMLFSWSSYFSKPVCIYPSPATLESLPYELLEQIFRNACTDGGRTGCALSLVSKRIRALSRSSRFHSVSLLSGTCSQLSCFLDTFERARKEAAASGEATPRVRHLCILLTTAQGSFIPSGPYFASCPLDVEPKPGDLSREDPLPYAERRVILAEACAAYKNEIDTLFASAGTADLETLYAFQTRRNFSTDEEMPRIACPEGFPRLRELTLHPAYAPVFVSGADGGTDNSQLEGGAFYPVLERLHIRSDADAAIDFAWWATNAPALEHLRVVCDGYAGKGPKFMPSLLSAICESHRLFAPPNHPPYIVHAPRPNTLQPPALPRHLHLHHALAQAPPRAIHVPRPHPRRRRLLRARDRRGRAHRRRPAHRRAPPRLRARAPARRVRDGLPPAGRQPRRARGPAEGERHLLQHAGRV
ncbi:hypothetical protein C8Q70DRAFT_246810 [Cubamyces menziesii]|nr:hypothetical protein C8Q70DRAFT_246810 [Cubamyces menziesii]